MISIAYGNSLLMGNQLFRDLGGRGAGRGDRPFSSDRPSLRPGGARHAAPAWLGATRRPDAFPRRPPPLPPQGLPRAHRLWFWQRASRQAQVAKLGSCAASDLLGPGVGVRVDRVRSALSSPAWGRGCGLFVSLFVCLRSWRRKIERTISGLRPAIGFSGAGAPALMRAPASGVMGWRP